MTLSLREKREIALQALLMRDRKRFLAEYKQALGLAAGASGPIGESYAFMIDEILNAEFAASKGPT